MERYKALFTNKHISVNAEVLNYCLDNTSDHSLILKIDEVIIDVNRFEELIIEDAEQYEEQQLINFEYEIIHPYEDKQKNDLLLINFHLDIIIPIQGLDKRSNKTQLVDLQVHMHSDEKRVYKYYFKLLNATSELSDITDALLEIQNKLKDSFVIEICALCKNSNWNPYGGVPFFNHLCFRANKVLFGALKDYDKHTVSSFMSDAKWQFTYATYRCEEFLPYQQLNANT